MIPPKRASRRTPRPLPLRDDVGACQRRVESRPLALAMQTPPAAISDNRSSSCAGVCLVLEKCSLVPRSGVNGYSQRPPSRIYLRSGKCDADRLGDSAGAVGFTRDEARELGLRHA